MTGREHSVMSTVLDALERNLEVSTESEAIAYTLYRFVFQVDGAKLSACRSAWKHNHMFRTHVSWLSFFAASRPICCTRWNHQNGQGCERDPCRAPHRCYLCNSEDHGVFFDDDNGGWKCDFHAVLAGDIAELGLEWGEFFDVAERLLSIRLCFLMNEPKYQTQALEKDEFIAHVRSLLLLSEI